MMKNRYFYLMMEEQKILGPFWAATLDKMYRSGTLSGDALLSADKTSWAPLRKVLYEFQEDVPVPAPCVLREPPSAAPQPAAPSAPHKKQVVVKPALSPAAPPRRRSVLRVIGSTLNLMWNMPDKLEELSDVSLKLLAFAVLPVCFFFPLLLIAAAALSATYFYPDNWQKLIFAGVTAGGSFLLNLLLAFIFLSEAEKPKGKARLTMLTSGALWISWGAFFSIVILNYTISTLTPPGALPVWGVRSYEVLTLLSGTFFCTNFLLGIRKALTDFYAFRPRSALWGTVLFAGLTLAIFKTTAEIAVRILN